MKVWVRPQARLDVLELAEYFATIHSARGEAFISQFEETLDLLARFPALGSESPDPGVTTSEVRFFPVRQFRNYLIAFQPREDGIEVIRVIDGRRDLGSLFADF